MGGMTEGSSVKRAGSMTVLLVGLLLLITAAGLFAALVPIVRTPKCFSCVRAQLDEPVIFLPEPSGAPSGSPPIAPPNDFCGAGVRITIMAHWMGKSWWEKSTIGSRASRGFRKNNSGLMLDRAGIRIGERVTKGFLDDAKAALLATGEFQRVQMDVTHYTEGGGKVKVLTVVVER